jgi:hemerythrin
VRRYGGIATSVRACSRQRRLTLDEIAERAEDLINGWFYQHILTVDAEYVDAVKASQVPPAAE